MNKNIINILLAEDDPDDQLMVREAFEENRLHNHLHIVEDGIELLDFLRNQGKYKDPEFAPRPGLILLDLNMPRMDGRKALEEIKKDPNLKSIPIVILTTSKAEEDILRTYDLGANSFIIKPVTFDQLVKIIKTITEYWIEIVQLPRD
ncbi:MAG: response regulator [Bacteroidales bacterium]|nr:response regulator [Bacteroidales bacterium]